MPPSALIRFMDRGSVCLSVLRPAQPSALNLERLIWAHTRGKKRDALVTPVERKVGVGEYTVRYAEAGKGENLVLLHGSDHRENWRVWEPLLQLSEGNHLIMPDLLGYGGSSKPIETPDHRKQALFLHELLERLSLRRVSIVGSSWGGQIALEYALEWPGTVD